MIDHDVGLLLIGAVIALVSSLIAALVQHSLSLRTDRIKREREEEEERRRQWLEGVTDRAIIIAKQTQVQGIKFFELKPIRMIEDLPAESTEEGQDEPAE